MMLAMIYVLLLASTLSNGAPSPKTYLVETKASSNNWLGRRRSDSKVARRRSDSGDHTLWEDVIYGDNILDADFNPGADYSGYDAIEQIVTAPVGGPYPPGSGVVYDIGVDEEFHIPVDVPHEESINSFPFQNFPQK